MIPNAYIQAWRQYAPWANDNYIEQDLILSRLLVELYNNPIIKDSLAFRGGTALYKLYIQPPARYSEDLDFVQVNAAPIGKTLDAIRKTIDPILGEPKRKFNEGRVTLLYKFLTETTPAIPMRVKIEINTREHFSVDGWIQKPFPVISRWFTGEAQITTYSLNELIGTKIRALYQRKKGRDLFDLWMVLQHRELVPAKAVDIFLTYMQFENIQIKKNIFQQNLEDKLQSSFFLEDISPLLSPALNWNMLLAAQEVQKRFVDLLPN